MLKGIAPELKELAAKECWSIDDLTDTGKTAVRGPRHAAEGAFRLRLCQARRRADAIVHLCWTEVSQDTWIYFTWDMEATYQEPIAKAPR